MPVPKVNLFVVGAPKSGTTTLYEYCARHPEIAVPENKEPHYFGEYRAPGSPLITSDEQYISLFPDRVRDGVEYLADFTPSYLYATHGAAAIKAYNPDAKIIAFLRNPAERTISMYFHQRKSLLEPLDFLSALDAEPERIRSGWGYGFHYKSASLYHGQVSRYMDAFGERFQVYFFEEFVRDTDRVLENISAFLGLSSGFPSLAIHTNRTGEPRSLFLQKLISREYPGKKLLRTIMGKKLVEALIAANIGAKPAIDPEIKAELAQFFTPDIERLEALLGRKSGWLEPG